MFKTINDKDNETIIIIFYYSNPNEKTTSFVQQNDMPLRLIIPTISTLPWYPFLNFAD